MKELLEFAISMDKKLRENSHKSGWWSMTGPQLIRRLKQEVGELERAIKANKPVAQIQGEAADVGNFAMFIHDNCQQWTATRTGGRGRDECSTVEDETVR